MEVYEGYDYKTKEPIKIEVENGEIVSVEKSSYNGSCFIAPGLVDLQINGYKGFNFNRKELKESDVIAVTHLIWEQGVTTYFPTIVTNSDENILASLEVIATTCENNRTINKSIGGIHLEGPFLSEEDGPRGAHPLKYIKAPDWKLFCKWQEAAGGRIRIITLTPEWPGSIDFIKRCVRSGVTVSIGHTSANSEQIQEAIDAGASMSTHLGNAAHLLLPRHPNYIWDQLAADDLWSTIIADGFHLPQSVLKVFLKVKPEKCLLVSDATNFAGLEPGSYTSHIGGEVELNEAGRLYIRDNPKLLAGSAQSLLWCVNHLVNSGITSLENALEMASVKPMEALSVTAPNRIEKGKSADLILFERKDKEIKLVQTIKSGRPVFSKEQ
ncbi:N-acetylglucosamine-6-phosphate deacetylase [Autumnicola musiva]|uniref:Amidohydrolase family protein n=1 Tax=Autumnicola musiva TaxID=3075589 RepID=A0ABU3D6M9_9FLAO|nr:amidohydrolase family protein [Zunongwangia sp. F117]MDT0677188.1 amidohydrolase family protein [Zunongwangia sp. F117]